MNETNGAVEAVPAGGGPASAGARLREARLAAELSIDAVAQQLKLAPRQVKALEDDDYAALPGRTFVRGFVRNYARVLRLDAATVLAALPEGDAAPTLNQPSLAPTPRAMGELPADQQTKPGSARWAVPLALVAIVGIAAVYEWTRVAPEPTRAAGGGRTSSAVAPATTQAPAADAAPTTAATATPGATATDTHPGADAARSAAGTPATSPVATPAAATPALPAGAPPVVLVFRGSSWVEVKDGKGAILLSTMGFPGATHAVDGAPPLEVVIGNAEVVAVTVRGEYFDLVPHTRQNVAKFTVK